MTTKTTLLPSHCVRARRYFYGPSETTSIVFIGTLAECREFIRKDNAEIYRTSHNESGRWSLRIVTTNSLRAYARQQAVLLFFLPAMCDTNLRETKQHQ